jgi:ABC-2 type transport system ATP-binding protein
VIEAHQLTRYFGDRIAVDNLSFTIGAGEIFALLGPNGAGKTTTMRMLGALIPPSSGRVRVNGIDLTRRTAGAIRSHVGLLTETPGLWDRLSVRVNLMVYARLFGLPHAAARVDDALRQFNLWDRRNDSAAVLSKGMKQKVAIARALLHQPSAVLLDEPTAGLDPKTARDVRELILGLRGSGCAVLVSTHNLDEAERVADRIGVLEKRLLALDTPSALRRRFFGRRITIVTTGSAAGFVPIVSAITGTPASADGQRMSVSVDDPDRQTPAIVRALVGAGADILQVVEELPPLEEVYLRVLGKE